MNHITVIHMGAIGDLVQAMPTLRAVRAKWPAARILIVGRCERTALAHMAGLVDACADFDVFAHAPAASRQADLLIDLFAPAMTKPRHTAGEVCRIDPLPPAGWAQPASVWLLRQAAARLDLPPVPETPEMPVPQPLLDEARGLLAARGIGERFAAIGAGSGSTKKNWPLERFQEIARRLRQDAGARVCTQRGEEKGAAPVSGRSETGAVPFADSKAPDPLAGRQIVWLSGPAEQERGTLAPLPPTETVLADLTLEQVAAVLALADVYLGNDSGITQVAAAVRRPGGRATPTVALFGPTNVQVWGTPPPRGRSLASPDGAMTSLAPDQVWAALRSLFP